MTRLFVLIPSRQRPGSVGAMARAFANTCTADTTMIWCIDGDPDEDDYRTAVEVSRATFYPAMRIHLGHERRRLVGTLNFWSVMYASRPDRPCAIAYLGDDHRPATYGWDSAYLAALKLLGAGIVYGDDGHQGANLPTQMAMTTDIVRALGYLAPPPLTHMYCDNFWKDLGEGAGCLLYLPDVKVTHLHPGAGKGSWDASYHESNSAGSYATDKAAYERYRAEELPRAVDIVKNLRSNL